MSKPKLLLVIGGLATLLAGGLWVREQEKRTTLGVEPTPIRANSETPEENTLSSPDAPTTSSRLVVEEDRGDDEEAFENAAGTSAERGTAEPNFLLRARLVDPEGIPVPNARLHSKQEAGFPQPFELQASPDGKVEGILRRSVLRKNGYLWWEAEGSNGFFLWGAARVREAPAVDLGDLVLRRFSRYRGRLVDEEGRPLEGVTVVISMEAGDGMAAGEKEESWGGESDADGQFTDRVLASGHASIRAQGCSGYASDSHWSSQPVETELAFGRTTDLGDIPCFPCTPPSAPQVRFVDELGNSVRAQHAFLRSSAWTGELSLAEDGSAVELMAYLEDAARIDLLVLAGEEELWALWDGPVRDVRSGLTLTLKPMDTLSLWVHDRSSTRLPVVSVRVEDQAWGFPLVESRAEEIEHTDAGRVEVRVPGRPLRVEVRVGRSPEPEALSFDRPPSGEVDVPVEDPYPDVSGVVRWEGHGVADARVTLHQGPRAAVRFMANNLPARFNVTAAQVTHTNERGEFRIPCGLSLRAVLVVRAEGFPDRVVDLPSDPLGATLEVQLKPAGRVEGEIVLADGTDPAGACIALSRGALDSRTARADAEGRFHFENVAPGDWHLFRFPFDVEADENPGSGAVDGDPWPGDLPPTVSVSPEETAHVYLLLEAPESHAIRGRLLVDGSAGSGWSVHVGPKWGRSTPGSEGAETRTDAKGRFELIPRGSGPFVWNAWNRDGRITLSREVTFPSESDDIDWDVDLHLVPMEIEFGPETRNASYAVDLGDGLSATGWLEDEGNGVFRTKIPAGLVEWWPEVDSTTRALLGPAPMKLTGGEAVRVSFP